MLQLKRTARNYAAALRADPPQSRVIGWPATFPSAGGMSLHGLWDDVDAGRVRGGYTSFNGMGDVASDIINAAVPGATAAVAAAQQKLSDLQTAIKAILALSAVAAVTGTLVFLRGR